MKCLNPTIRKRKIKGRVYEYRYNCNKCDNCLINRKNRWKLRILLESLDHPENSFITLTYQDAFLPKELRKNELQKFFKRLRRDNPERIFRYFAVGENGSETGRPHYHVMLFGHPSTDREIIEKAWSINVGTKDEPRYVPLGS